MFNAVDTRALPAPQKVSAWRAFTISGLGTALEFYDFIIYGLAAALVFPQLFFPTQDPLVGTLVAFMAFGVGFIARPLGAIVFGHFGDRIGRKPVLVLTLILMGVSTFLIGCLPTYDTVGALAPVLLVTLRLLQGFAAGGEWGGSSLFGIENSPENRRGFWGSFTSTGIGIGSMLGSLVFLAVENIPGVPMEGIGWRIPFWIGGALVIIGLIARSKMPDEENVSEHAPRVPILAAIRRQPVQMLLAIGVSLGYNTIAYIGSIFTITYSLDRGYTDSESLWFQIVGGAAFMIAAPLMGLASDKVGRKWLVCGGAVVYALFFFAYLGMIDSKIVILALLANLVLNVLMAMPQGVIPAFLGEQFSKEFRYSSLSATYQVGAAIGGGLAAPVATALLLGFGGNSIGVALYSTAACALIVLCGFGLRETFRKSTAELGE